MENYGETLRRFFRGKVFQRNPIHNHSHSEFVVIGLGRFGSSLAMTLHEYGHDVLAIDADMTLVQCYSNDLPHVVHVDATNRAAFEELGIGNFDTGLVCIGSDFESNMLATVLLRQLGVRRVICKTRTRTQRDILLKIGADECILPEHEAGVRLGRKLASAGFVDVMQVSDDISVVEIVAPLRLVRRSLLKSNLREKYGVVVVAIRRSDGVIVLPTAQEVIKQGDVLVLIGRSNDCEALMKV